MAKINLKCEICGAISSVDDNDNNPICSACGNPIFKKEVVEDISLADLKAIRDGGEPCFDNEVLQQAEGVPTAIDEKIQSDDKSDEKKEVKQTLNRNTNDFRQEYLFAVIFLVATGAAVAFVIFNERYRVVSVFAVIAAMIGFVSMIRQIVLLKKIVVIVEAEKDVSLQSVMTKLKLNKIESATDLVETAIKDGHLTGYTLVDGKIVSKIL